MDEPSKRPPRPVRPRSYVVTIAIAGVALIVIGIVRLAS